MVPNFQEVLSNVKCPVLAIFGEKDSQVDWRETESLYKKVMKDNLTVAVLPNCNHHLLTCETGGFTEQRQALREKGLGQVCEGYYDVIADWIRESALD